MKQIAISIVFYAAILMGLLPLVSVAEESAPPPVDRCSTPISHFAPSDGSVFFLDNQNPELLSTRKIEQAIDDYWNNCDSYGSGSPSILFEGPPPPGALEIEVKTIAGQRLHPSSNLPLSPGYFLPDVVYSNGRRTMTGGTITLWTKDEQNRLNALHDTLAHELGHAYGLGHPDSDDAGLCTGRIIGGPAGAGRGAGEAHRLALRLQSRRSPLENRPGR